MKVVITNLLFLGVFFVHSNGANAFLGESKDALAPKKTKKEVQGDCRIWVQVSGMTCSQGCVPYVEKKLKAIPNVLHAKVLFKTKNAWLVGKGEACDAKKTKTLLDKTFAKIHYKAKIVRIEKTKIPLQPSSK